MSQLRSNGNLVGKSGGCCSFVVTATGFPFVVLGMYIDPNKLQDAESFFKCLF